MLEMAECDLKPTEDQLYLDYLVKIPRTISDEVRRRERLRVDETGQNCMRVARTWEELHEEVLDKYNQLKSDELIEKVRQGGILNVSGGQANGRGGGRGGGGHGRGGRAKRGGRHRHFKASVAHYLSQGGNVF